MLFLNNSFLVFTHFSKIEPWSDFLQLRDISVILFSYCESRYNIFRSYKKAVVAAKAAPVALILGLALNREYHSLDTTQVSGNNTFSVLIL